jgi:ribose transport system substrate-binding protein
MRARLAGALVAAAALWLGACLPASAPGGAAPPAATAPAATPAAPKLATAVPGALAATPPPADHPPAGGVTPARAVGPAPSPSPAAEAEPSPSGLPTGAGDLPAGTGEQSRFFNNADFEKQLAQRSMKPEGPADQPWVQAIDPTYVDTSKYKKGGPWNVCFSNAATGDPWRDVGWTTMQAEAALKGDITLNAVDAGGRDDKQIADLADLGTQRCDAIVVSPNTTAALTPAVQRACDTGVPIIVFDRGVTTECPVTFIHPIGGYAFGADAAEFLVAHVKKGGNVLALRTLPGVDALETRWSAAKVIFDQQQVKVVGVQFTDGDPAKVKAIVAAYIRRFGSIDGVWMDSGSTSVAATEAFEEARKPIPPITGEDHQGFLRKWKAQQLTAVAPTYPTYQWRTAIIAVRLILTGAKVPKEWVLPQPVITSDNLDEYLFPSLPDTFFALCGCQTLPGFPERWGGKR